MIWTRWGPQDTNYEFLKQGNSLFSGRSPFMLSWGSSACLRSTICGSSLVYSQVLFTSLLFTLGQCVLQMQNISHHSGKKPEYPHLCTFLPQITAGQFSTLSAPLDLHWLPGFSTIDIPSINVQILFWKMNIHKMFCWNSQPKEGQMMLVAGLYRWLEVRASEIASWLRICVSLIF